MDLFPELSMGSLWEDRKAQALSGSSASMDTGEVRQGIHIPESNCYITPAVVAW